jgi:hypothetical protein
MQFFITWFKRQRHIWTYSLRSLKYVKGYLPLLSLQTRRVFLLMGRAKKDSSLFGLMAQFSLDRHLFAPFRSSSLRLSLLMPRCYLHESKSIPSFPFLHCFGVEC